MKNFTLECCVDSLESAVAAQEGGATRLELCGNLPIGGTTPSVFLLDLIRESGITTPARAMVRPRCGDFCYDDSEFRQMIREVEQFSERGADGVVFGIILPDGSLDAARMGELCRRAGNMRVTLHRAFDMTRDPMEALKRAADLGIDTVLTSGQRSCAAEGAELIAELVEKSEGTEILVGGGVDAGVLAQLRAKTGASAYHMSARKTVKSDMVYRNPVVSMGLPSLSEYERWVTDREKVAAARAVLEQIE